MTTISLCSFKIAAALLFLCVLILAGCSSEQTPKTRLLLDWMPNPNHIPLYVGINKEIFASHNIALEIQKTHDPSDLVGYLRSGRADLILYYMPNVIRAQAKNYPVKPIGILIEEPLNALIYRKGEHIQRPEDLSGKTIGYCVDGTSTAVLDLILNQNQILHTNKKNVTFDLVSTLGTKKVDAIYGAFWNIEGEHLRSLGVDTDHFTLKELGIPNYYELMVVANNSTLQEFIERFQLALQESINYSINHPHEAFVIYATMNQDKTEKTLKWEEKAWLNTIPSLAKKQHIDPKMWKEFSDWLEENLE